MPLGLVLTQPALAIMPKAFLVRESGYCRWGRAGGGRRWGARTGRKSQHDSSNGPHPPHTSVLGSDRVQAAHHRVHEPVPLALQGLTAVWGPEHGCLQKPQVALKCGQGAERVQCAAAGVLRGGRGFLTHDVLAVRVTAGRPRSQTRKSLRQTEGPFRGWCSHKHSDSPS